MASIHTVLDDEMMVGETIDEDRVVSEYIRVDSLLGRALREFAFRDLD